jgi:hypothetical protein
MCKPIMLRQFTTNKTNLAVFYILPPRHTGGNFTILFHHKTGPMFTGKAEMSSPGLVQGQRALQALVRGYR